MPAKCNCQAYINSKPGITVKPRYEASQNIRSSRDKIASQMTAFNHVSEQAKMYGQAHTDCQPTYSVKPTKTASRYQL